MNDIEKIQSDLIDIKYVLMKLWESRPMTSRYMHSTDEHNIDRIMDEWTTEQNERCCLNDD